MENWPALVCVGLITLLFVVPAWVYIQVTERRARVERAKAIEAGRHEPVTIQPYVNLAVCMGSGACVPACPEHVFKVIDGQAVAVNMSACIGHGTCVTACPVNAIELVFGSEKRGIDIPEVGPNFETNVPGLFVAGELGGMGLIANAAEQGVKALANATVGLRKQPGRHDVVIVGAGPAGIAAGLAAKEKGLDYVIVDQDAVGGAIRHYPRKKLVFTRPMVLPLYGTVNLKQLQKEELVTLFDDVVRKTGLRVADQERVDEVARVADGGFQLATAKRKLEAQRVILALGRRGTPRKLDARGEDQEKVAYSLLEPEHYEYDHILVVGGGDSAVEAAIQLGEQPGNKVTLSYRGDKINRPKEKNIERLRDAVKAGQVELLLESTVKEIAQDRVVLDHKGEPVVLPNDYVFVMVGGVLPTRFLQKAGIRISKHFGKRVEAMEVDEVPVEGGRDRDRPNPKSAPTAILSESSRANDDQTVPRAGPNPEETISLPPGGDETTAPRAGVGPVPAVAAGLGSLDTHVLPNLGGPDPEPTPTSPSPDPAPNRSGHVRHREVTEIQPLKRIATPGADARRPPSTQEETVPLPDRPPPAPAEPTPPPEPLGRVVAKRPAPAPSPAAPPAPEPPSEPPPRPEPVSTLSARFSRNVVAARAALTKAAPQNPPTSEPARPEARPKTATPPGGPARTTGPTPSPPPERAPEAPRAAEDSGVVQPFVKAARALLDEGRFRDVLAMAGDLRGLVERSAATLSDRDIARARRWAAWLEGEARLGLGEWEEALAPLEAAVDAARLEGSTEGLGAALAALGRACHHTGHHDRARLVLEEALRVGERPRAERTAILRLLGDLSLRRGDLDTAERQWAEALADAAGSPDAEARAWRGVAHCKAIRGELQESMDHLVRAEGLLGADADPHVRAGLLLRRVELDNVMGRYGVALKEGERLVALANGARLLEYRAEAVALLAETLAAVGLADDAADAARQVPDLIRGTSGPISRHRPPADALLRAARALCDVGRLADAARVLEKLPEELGAGLIDDPEGQLLAIRARSVARVDPALGRELANQALARPAPLLAIRAARIRLDAALALIDAGASAPARAAVKRGLKVLQGHGTRGLKLEMLVAMYLADPDTRVVEALARTGLKVLEDVPSHAQETFRSRAVIGDALSRWKE